jgi:hypothetical protein
VSHFLLFQSEPDDLTQYDIVRHHPRRGHRLDLPSARDSFRRQDHPRALVQSGRLGGHLFPSWEVKYALSRMVGENITYLITGEVVINGASPADEDFGLPVVAESGKRISTCMNMTGIGHSHFGERQQDCGACHRICKPHAIRDVC